MINSLGHSPGLKRKKKTTQNNTRRMRQVGVSKPSQCPFWPFIARFIALVFHEMLLKMVFFKV